MVWSLNGNMENTNQSMWNSPTHAMSDISALAYRRNVPASEIIVPAEVARSHVSFQETIRNNMCQSNLPDVSWNKLGNGRGRGALLHNRDILHRNDQELQRQLRIANGLGYSNYFIEARFRNSSPPRAVDDRETAGPLLSYNDDDLGGSSSQGNKTTEDEATSQEKKEREEEDLSLTSNGDWNWEKRTVMPAPNRVILKNVALQSLKRQKQKAKPVEENPPSEIVAPTGEEPSLNVVKVKEDWRAEIKAKEEAARRSEAAEADVLTASPKAKKGWRSEPQEPLLGDLKIDSNWSIFAPNVTPLVAEDKHMLLPPPEPGQQPAVECPPKSLLELGNQNSQRHKKSKKKKNQNVRPMVAADRLFVESTVAPPGYLMPINGVSPMAIRNSEYNPLAGHNHRTFGNLFGKAITELGTNNRKTYKTSDSFSLENGEFPQLK